MGKYGKHKRLEEDSRDIFDKALSTAEEYAPLVGGVIGGAVAYRMARRGQLVKRGKGNDDDRLGAMAFGSVVGANVGMLGSGAQHNSRGKHKHRK